jgi:hypothetical protein
VEKAGHLSKSTIDSQTERGEGALFSFTPRFSAVIKLEAKSKEAFQRLIIKPLKTVSSVHCGNCHRAEARCE